MATQKDMKAFISACGKGDLAKVKEFIEKGFEPETYFEGDDGLLRAMNAHAWYMEMKPDDKANIGKIEEVIKYLNGIVDLSKYEHNTPLCGLLWRINTGAHDKTVEFVLDNGYPLEKDTSVSLMAGCAGFPLAKRILETVGASDKTVFYAAHNPELMEWLIEQNIPLNTPFESSNGTVQYPIMAAMSQSADLLKKMLDAGADPDLVNTGYGKSTRQLVLEGEYISDDVKALFR